VYYNRLMRDGWIRTGRTENGRHDAVTYFEKELSRDWRLRKLCHEQIGAPKGKGCYWDEHVLASKAGDESVHQDWEWAERLGGSVVYAKHGCLYRAVLKNSKSIGDEELVHDFNGYTFEMIEAPY
ncbi:MAG TPA: hypothetical protein VHL50_11725, partial [Pyrinomonadaceae bacterium]|nr:hypothetical protein [Pyrinomonadaceae bacterium]